MFKKSLRIFLMMMGVLFCFPMVMGMVFYIIDPFGGDTEWEHNRKLEKECLDLRLAKGYPEKIAREYCSFIKGCVKKEYEENCNVEIKCCFATVEEDKKWNYLDYDKNGNKIKK